MLLVADHVKKAHKVEATSNTIANYLKEKFRQV